MMSIKEPAKADDVYLNVWFPMQQALGKDTLQRIENLEMFLRHYMVMIKQTVVKEDKIYTEIRGRLKHYNEDQMISELQIISEYSKLYERLLFPERETDPEISKGIERLNRLKIGVHYPFLLKIYKNFASQKVSKDDFCSILKIIESYIVRRFFKRLPTHSLNRLFAELCKLHESNISNELETLLANKEEWTAQYWPKDEDFKEQFLKLPIYKISSEKCRFVLETLEEYFKHPEPVKLDNLWIEHIMPETLSPEWKEYLGENWKATYDNYLHTIGNLTLIAPDRDISIQNKMYSEKKKEWYDTSNISLTRELKDNWDNWRESQILERAKILAERAIKIWPRPE